METLRKQVARVQRRLILGRFFAALAWCWAGGLALAALAIAFGVIFGVVVGHGAVSGEGIDPSQKARALAEGISEAMNWSAFGLLIALVAALWLGFCTWRWRQGSR